MLIRIVLNQGHFYLFWGKIEESKIKRKSKKKIEESWIMKRICKAVILLIRQKFQKEMKFEKTEYSIMVNIYGIRNIFAYM